MRIAIILGIFFFLLGCAAFSPDAPEEVPIIENLAKEKLKPEIEETPKETQKEKEIIIEVIAENLEVPWAIDFLPTGELIFTERPGKVKIVEKGFVHEVKGVVQISESGLQGIAVHPDFEENSFVYLYYTYTQEGGLFNRVSRFVLKERSLENEEVLLERIPGNVFHDGGRIKFGPDNKLYITTGDSGNTDLSRDLESVAGKILRMNDDGTVPNDNPFENSLVYSFGHRNPQGISWHPETRMLVATEHGPTQRDEVNVIEVGKNYGWPDKLCNAGTKKENFIEAVICFDAWTMAPSGATFYSGNQLPYNNAFIYTGLRGEQLRITKFENSDVISDEKLLDGFGRLRDIVEGPDGWLYFATSNTDGRGKPKLNDDKIYRIKFE